MPLEIAEQVCNTYGGISFEALEEISYHNCGENSLPCTGNPRAEQGLLFTFPPVFVVSAVEQPLPCAVMLPLDSVTQLRAIVYWSEPIEKFVVFALVAF